MNTNIITLFFSIIVQINICLVLFLIIFKMSNETKSKRICILYYFIVLFYTKVDQWSYWIKNNVISRTYVYFIECDLFQCKFCHCDIRNCKNKYTLFQHVSNHSKFQQPLILNLQQTRRRLRGDGSHYLLVNIGNLY